MWIVGVIAIALIIDVGVVPLMALIFGLTSGIITWFVTNILITIFVCCVNKEIRTLPNILRYLAIGIILIARTLWNTLDQMLCPKRVG